MKILGILSLVLAITVCVFGIGDAVAGGKYEPRPKYEPGVSVRQDLDLTVRNKNYTNSEAYSNSKSFAMGGNATGGKAIANGYGQGGNGYGGQGGNGYGGQGGAANNGGMAMSNDYSQSYSVPRQTPFAYAPTAGMNSSFISCKNSVSVGASVPGGAGSLAFPVDDDKCDGRMDADHFSKNGLPRAACYRFTQDDANAKALADAGLTCNDIEKTAIAVPVIAAPIVQTPALDEYVQRKELEQKLNNAHRVGALK